MANSTDSDNDDENLFMKFWFDGVFRIFIGCLGFSMNSLAIWILISHKKMQSMFLHILTCSLIFDNGYLVMDMLTLLYYNIKVEALIWILPYITFPFTDIFYTANILITICLAHERYALISDSGLYRQTMSIAKFRHHRLIKYMIPIVLFSFMFNINSFLTHTISPASGQENSTATTAEWKITKTDMKRAPSYNIFGKSVKWSVFLIASFLLLVFFNWKVFTNVKEKLSMRNQLPSVSIEINKKESHTESAEKRQSRLNTLNSLRNSEKFTLALFALVTSFFFCNIWFLGEMIFDGIGNKSENYEIISRLMRMLNACTNVLVYCIVDHTFKKYFKNYLLYLMSCTLVDTDSLLEGQNNSHCSERPARPVTAETSSRLSSRLSNLFLPKQFTLKNTSNPVVTFQTLKHQKDNNI